MKMVELGACCKIISGSTPSRLIPEYWNGNIYWFTPKDISNLSSKYVFEAPEKITDIGFKSCSTNIIPPNSLLFSSRAPIGHLAINKLACCTNQGFKTLVPNDNVDVEFLYYAIKRIVPKLQELGNGATFKELSKTTLEKFQIPLPPLATQKKIAAILDAADEYRQKTKAIIEKYDQLAQSLFLEMFGDPVRNEKGWEKVALKKLCSFQKESILPEKIINGSNYIGLECIEKETGNILEVKKVVDGELKSNKFLFDDTCILYGKLRPYLNKVALPTFKGICSTDIIPIKPLSGKSQKFFICYIMRSKGFVNFANERTCGANLPRISPSIIADYLIINPPFALQNQFAEHIKLIQAQKQQAQASLQKAEDLFNSLLQRAFKGELV